MSLFPLRKQNVSSQTTNPSASAAITLIPTVSDVPSGSKSPTSDPSIDSTNTATPDVIGSFVAITVNATFVPVVTIAYDPDHDATSKFNSVSDTPVASTITTTPATWTTVAALTPAATDPYAIVTSCTTSSGISSTRPSVTTLTSSSASTTNVCTTSTTTATTTSRLSTAAVTTQTIYIA